MSPAAALILLVLAGAAVVVAGIRRDRRRVDPLTPDQLERAIAVQREREARDA